MKHLLTIALLALLASQVASARDVSELPAAPGERFDVGGHSLHLYCTGDGAPTVVMDAGMGDWSLQFRALQERVAPLTRVCTYDRAGYGWSDAGPEPRTVRRNVDELEALLAAAGEEGPFVLVGHSYGGLGAILFAHRHPDLTAGVVLLDASHPEQVERMAAVPELVAMEQAGMEQLRMLARTAERSTLPADAVIALAPQGIPEALRQPWAELFVQPKSLQAALAEYDALEESLAQVREGGSLGDVPLVVIAHGLRMSDTMPAEAREQAGLPVEVLDRYETIWRALQEDHATRSSESESIVAEESTHYVHFMQPDLVVAAIERLVLARR